MATTNVPVTLETPIVIKVLFRGQTKKIKLPLKDLGAHILPDKVRHDLHRQPAVAACLAHHPSRGSSATSN